MVKLVAFIGKLRVVAHNNKTVRKAAGNHELLFVLIRKQDPRPLAVCIAVFPQVNSNVEHLALQHAHELCLGMCFLEMKTAQHTLTRAGLIVLHKHIIETGRIKGFLLIGLHKVAAVISIAFLFNHKDTVYFGFGECKITNRH